MEMISNPKTKILGDKYTCEKIVPTTPSTLYITFIPHLIVEYSLIEKKQYIHYPFSTYIIKQVRSKDYRFCN